MKITAELLQIARPAHQRAGRSLRTEPSQYFELFTGFVDDSKGRIRVTARQLIVIDSPQFNRGFLALSTDHFLVFLLDFSFGGTATSRICAGGSPIGWLPTGSSMFRYEAPPTTG